MNEGAGALRGLAPDRRASDPHYRAPAHAAVQEPARGGARGADHPRRLAPLEGRRHAALLRRAPLEFWLGLATLLGVITLDVLPGLVIGVASMLLLVIYRAQPPASRCWDGARGDWRVRRRRTPPDYEPIRACSCSARVAAVLRQRCQLVETMHSAGIDVAFAHVRQPVIDMAETRRPARSAR